MKVLRRILAKGIAQLPSGLLTDPDFFDLYQSRGWHILPNHYYTPIPDTTKLRPSLWSTNSAMTGVDRNMGAQVALLEEIADTYLPEYHAISDREPTSPTEYTRAADGFPGIDGAMLYSLIRKHKPRRIVEIGSGHSSLLSMLALARNRESDPAYEGRLTSIEPYPECFLHEALARANMELVQTRVEDAPMSIFGALEDNDILFIDSSHTVRIGGDVLWELLEIVPRLKRGVLIHIHDIFLPYHYPMDWVKQRRSFWAEQYVLQAFLAFNSAYEILWSPGCMRESHPALLAQHFPGFNPDYPEEGSFWMRKVD